MATFAVAVFGMAGDVVVDAVILNLDLNPCVPYMVCNSGVALITKASLLVSGAVAIRLGVADNWISGVMK